MRYFKIDLPIMLRLRVLEDLSIDLFNTITDVIRRPVHFNTIGGYRTEVIAATYDLIGIHESKTYCIRVYSRIDAETRPGVPILDRYTRENQEDDVYAYHMTFWEWDLQVYRLWKRFPIIHDIELYPGIFCEYVVNPESLLDINGNPLCLDHGHPPVITLTDGDISLARDTVWVEPGYQALDIEDGDITADVIITGDVDTSSEGNYVLTYSVTDSDGNRAIEFREVTIYHTNVPPIIALNATITGEFNPIHIEEGSVWSDPGATAHDTEDGDLTDQIVVTGETVDTSIPKVYQLTYTVTDSDGASASVTRDVVVEHVNQPPTITLNGDINGVKTPIHIIEGTTWNDPGATATDFEDGDLTDQIVVTGETVDTSSDGIYTIKYSVTDSNNATTSITREVVIEMYPTVNLNPFNGVDTPISIPWGSVWDDPGATATDPEDGDLTAHIVVSGSTVNTHSEGTYSITYSVTDSYGLTASATRHVTVEPNTPPVITLLGDNPVTLNFNSGFTDPGATAHDTEDGDLSGSIVVSGDLVDTSTPGTYNVTYTVTDSGGLSDTATREVIVKQDEPPTITLLGPSPQYIYAQQTWIDPGATAYDTEDGDLTAHIVVGGDTVDTQYPATFQVIYTVTDSAGQSASVTRVVIVNILS